MNLEDLSQDDVRDFVAVALFAGLKMSVDAGVPVQKALRAVVVEYLQESLGSQVWKELGMNQRTVERWRQEYRAVMQERDIEEEPPAEFIETLLRLQAAKQAKS
jgi:transposase-like protein